MSLIRNVKDDKNALEMLACAIIVKATYQNSCFYNLQITRIMDLFGVAHKKAHKVKESLKQSSFFIYNEDKDCVFAKSFKPKTFKNYGKGGKLKARADFCRKISVEVGNEERKNNTSLKELVRLLRETLLLCVIHASEQDNFIVSGLKKEVVTKPNVQRATPQRKFAKALGLSRSSANRYIKKLISREDIKRGDMLCECIIHHLNDDTLQDYFTTNKNDGLVAWYDEVSGSWSAWKMYGFEYITWNRTISESFKNVIFNYRYKNTSKKCELSCELDGEGYYGKRVY